MIVYELCGKVDPEIYDLILYDIDHNIPIKIVCGSGINANDANKIAAFNKPVHVPLNINIDVSDTVANLVNNSSNCVIVELAITKIGFTMGKTSELLSEYISNPKYMGSKLKLIEYANMPNMKLDQSVWNNIIVRCIDYGITLCWEGGASDRYRNYLESIV